MHVQELCVRMKSAEKKRDERIVYTRDGYTHKKDAVRVRTAANHNRQDEQRVPALLVDLVSCKFVFSWYCDPGYPALLWIRISLLWFPALDCSARLACS